MNDRVHIVDDYSPCSNEYVRLQRPGETIRTDIMQMVAPWQIIRLRVRTAPDNGYSVECYDIETLFHALVLQQIDNQKRVLPERYFVPFKKISTLIALSHGQLERIIQTYNLFVQKPSEYFTLYWTERLNKFYKLTGYNDGTQIRPLKDVVLIGKPETISLPPEAAEDFVETVKTIVSRTVRKNIDSLVRRDKEVSFSVYNLLAQQGKTRTCIVVAALQWRGLEGVGKPVENQLLASLSKSLIRSVFDVAGLTIKKLENTQTWLGLMQMPGYYCDKQFIQDRMTMLGNYLDDKRLLSPGMHPFLEATKFYATQYYHDTGRAKLLEMGLIYDHGAMDKKVVQRLDELANMYASADATMRRKIIAELRAIGREFIIEYKVESAIAQLEGRPSTSRVGVPSPIVSRGLSLPQTPALPPARGLVSPASRTLGQRRVSPVASVPLRTPLSSTPRQIAMTKIALLEKYLQTTGIVGQSALEAQWADVTKSRFPRDPSAEIANLKKIPRKLKPTTFSMDVELQRRPSPRSPVTRLPGLSLYKTPLPSPSPRATVTRSPGLPPLFKTPLPSPSPRATVTRSPGLPPLFKTPLPSPFPQSPGLPPLFKTPLPRGVPTKRRKSNGRSKRAKPSTSLRSPRPIGIPSATQIGTPFTTEFDTPIPPVKSSRRASFTPPVSGRARPVTKRARITPSGGQSSKPKRKRSPEQAPPGTLQNLPLASAAECQAILTTGARKGMRCVNIRKYGYYCGTHKGFCPVSLRQIVDDRKKKK